MKRTVILLMLLLPLVGIACASAAPATPTAAPAIPVVAPQPTPASLVTIKLPEPGTRGDVSLEEAILKRRSIREFSDKPILLREVSQLLWAAQGRTAGWGGRTAPSAGGLYPLEIYVAVGNVENLATGIYRYKPEKNELVMVKNGDFRKELAEAAVGQSSVNSGAINIVIAAIYERTTGKYGDRGIRYVYMEAGHAAQNVYLQATALDLGTVTIGAFYDDKVKAILAMPQNEVPLYIMPVGKKR